MREASLQASRNGPCTVAGRRGQHERGASEGQSPRPSEGRASIQGSHGRGSRKNWKGNGAVEKTCPWNLPLSWGVGVVIARESQVTLERSKRAAGEQAGHGLESEVLACPANARAPLSLKPGKESPGDPRNHARAQDQLCLPAWPPRRAQGPSSRRTGSLRQRPGHPRPGGQRGGWGG